MIPVCPLFGLVTATRPLMVGLPRALRPLSFQDDSPAKVIGAESCEAEVWYRSSK